VFLADNRRITRAGSIIGTKILLLKMSGAEALLVIGIIANIVQLVDFTSKVVGRVKDSAQDSRSIPKAFRNIQVTLPLLANTLRKTEDQVKSGKVDEQTCNALRPVLKACEGQVNELKAIFVQTLPAEGASRWTRGWKGISTLKKDKKVDDIARSLSELRSTLIHYHVTNLATRDGQHDIAAGLDGPTMVSRIDAEQRMDARQREVEERCLHSLAFPSMDSRRLGIEEPAEETCSWLFEHPMYQQWDSQDEVAMSHDLLWIKGKPGSGKSTLMKRLVERTEERWREGAICISFFFSARGAGLERSIEGLYRSLTYQLVWKRRTLLAQLALLADEKDFRCGRGNWIWHVKEIKEFFHASIAEAGCGPLKIFIDALDECKDDDVQEAVTAFEHSAAASMANGTVLDICWSSRHYPHIRVERSLVICMEHQNAKDIAAYVRNEVKNSSFIDHELESEIIRKANGVFMWVVLVFRQLLDAEDQGYSRAEKRLILQDLPSELDDLFRRILNSVKPRHRQTRTLLFQYCMVAREPLSARHMQFALAFSPNPPLQSIESWRSSDSYLEPHIAFANFIREVSGGLLEISESQATLRHSWEEHRRIQFIHESVRDFMQSGAGYQILGMADSNAMLRQGHQNLRNACLAYLGSSEVLGDLDRLVDLESSKYDQNQARPTLSEAEAAMYKFVGYAASEWPSHARKAEDTGQSQADLVQLTAKASFHGALRLWAAHGEEASQYWNRGLDRYVEGPYGPPTDGINTKQGLLWTSCVEGIVSCIRPLLEAGVDPLFEKKGRKLAWEAAALSRRPEVVRALLDHDVANVIDYPFAEDRFLHRELWSGGSGVVEVLLEHFSADSCDSDGQTPMQITILYDSYQRDIGGKTAIVRILAAHGADSNVRDTRGYSLLHLAVESDPRPKLISCLIDVGADVKVLDRHGRTVLHLAVLRDPRPDTIASLIDAGVDVKGLDSHGRTALHLAVQNIGLKLDSKVPRTFKLSSETLMNVVPMLNAGADANAQDKDGNTALHLAFGKRLSDAERAERSLKPQRHDLRNIESLRSVVQKLILYGADLTIKNNDGVTAADLINGLPDHIFEVFKLIIPKAVQTLQGANHVVITDT